jgi:hypothetical protein
MMLATWLVEIFLSKINHLEDVALSEGSTEEGENLTAEKSILEEDMREFLRSYKVRRSCVPSMGMWGDATFRTTWILGRPLT